MLYAITNVRLIKNESFDASLWGGVKNADGGHRLQYTLIDPEGEEDGTVTDLNSSFVGMYEQYYAEAQKAGTDAFGRDRFENSKLRDENNPAPDRLTHVRGRWVFVRFPGEEPYVPIRVDRNGNIQVVCKKGKAADGTRLFSTSLGVSVFVRCRLESDEDGKQIEVPRKGYEPEALMQSYIGSAFIPLSEAKSLMPTKPKVGKVGVEQAPQNAPLPEDDDDDQV